MELDDPAEVARLTGVSLMSRSLWSIWASFWAQTIGFCGALVAPGSSRAAGSGIPLEGLVAAFAGQVWLDFLDAPGFHGSPGQRRDVLEGGRADRGAGREALLIREAMGAVGRPDDRVRDAQLPYVDLIEAKLKVASVGRDPAASAPQATAFAGSPRRVRHVGLQAIEP